MGRKCVYYNLGKNLMVKWSNNHIVSVTTALNP